MSVEDEVEEGEQLYKKLDDVDELSLDHFEISDLIKEGGNSTTE